MNFLPHFIKSIENHPNKIAIQKGNEKISYKELWGEALKVYSYLKSNESSGELIGINADDGIKSYVYILGIWMYGGAYVPLSNQFPKEKNEKIIQEAGLKLVFSESNNWEISCVSISNLLFDEYIGEIIISDLAYVLFTSGTTGIPKGVKISKKNLESFLSYYLNYNLYQFSENDRFLQSYELTFDVSVFCFTLPLLLGGTLILLPNSNIKYLSILQTLEKEKITVTSNVPSTLKFSYNRLQELSFPDLRYSFFSGEALYGNWAKKWMDTAPKAKVYNCYGPTETTIVCTSECLNSLDVNYFSSELPLPLGQEFEGVDLKIINGEICFSGNQVFPGYLNQKTPFLWLNNKQYFPTGDLAELDNNGKLIFKGRKDRQIQLNGYRVELDEIDNLLQNHLNCSCKSFLISNVLNESILISAIEQLDFNEEKIKHFLSKKLPFYSIPQKFIGLKKFPYNSNNKLDISLLEKKLSNV